MDGWLGIGGNHGCQWNIVNRWSVAFGCKIWICGGVRFWIVVVSCGIFGPKVKSQKGADEAFTC